MGVSNINLHVLFYFIFFQIKKNSYSKFDVSKHYEGNKTAIKQLVRERIQQHKTAEEKIRVSCGFCNYTD